MEYQVQAREDAKAFGASSFQHDEYVGRTMVQRAHEEAVAIRDEQYRQGEILARRADHEARMIDDPFYRLTYSSIVGQEMVMDAHRAAIRERDTQYELGRQLALNAHE